MQYDSEIQNHKQVFVLCSVQDATCKFHKWQLSYFSKLPKTVIDVTKLQPYHIIEDMSNEELANQTDSICDRSRFRRLLLVPLRYTWPNGPPGHGTTRHGTWGHGGAAVPCRVVPPCRHPGPDTAL